MNYFRSILEDYMKLLPSTVINFHTIYDSVWMDDILYLLKRTYNLISLPELMSYYYEGSKFNNACHLTFDDGEKGFFDIVFPLLVKHDIKVSLFVSPKVVKERSNFWFQEIRGYNKNDLINIVEKRFNLSVPCRDSISIDAVLKSLPLQSILAVIDQYRRETNTTAKPPLNMCVEQLKELDASGFVTIGSHTLNHPILKNESDEVSKAEIKESIEELSDLLKKKVICFAYPNGIPDLDFNHREINYLQHSGIKIAFSAKNRTITKNDNPLNIPRNSIHHGSSRIFVLIKLISGRRWIAIRRFLLGKQEEEFRQVMSDLLNQ